MSCSILDYPQSPVPLGQPFKVSGTGTSEADCTVTATVGTTQLTVSVEWNGTDWKATITAPSDCDSGSTVVVTIDCDGCSPDDVDVLLDCP